MNRLWCINDLLLFLQHLLSALYPFQGSGGDHGTPYFGRKMYTISQFSSDLRFDHARHLAAK